MKHGANAQGGPPLITDDPDTPGPGFWEINLGFLMDSTPGARRIETPRVDLNYGVGRRIQLKFEMPWVVVQSEGQQAQQGAGNATVGVKWRFVGQEGKKIAWSVYPQLDFNTTRSSVIKHIEDDGYRLLIPTEITIEIFHLEINGEIGRALVQDEPGGWIAGVSTEAHVAPPLELLAEFHRDEQSELMVVAGGRLKLTSKTILLFAGGHSVRSVPADGPRTYVYTGLQLNLPRQFRFQTGSPAPTPALRPATARSGK